MRIAFGIDVAKNKSDVVAKDETGLIVYGPVTVNHDKQSLNELAKAINSMEGNMLVLMENTSMYWRQPAKILYESGIRVAVLNAILIHSFGINNIRNIKTDKADSYKIADYALQYWDELKNYSPEDEIRELLKMESRLYAKTLSLCGSVKNNLIAICDQAYPDVNKLFWHGKLDQQVHYKWVDYVEAFWHRDYVASFSDEQFCEQYREWCRNNKYRYLRSTAENIYLQSQNTISTFPYNDSTRRLVQQTARTLNSLYDDLFEIRQEMNALATRLPEYETVMAMEGCGIVTGPMLMAEIGDVTRFRNKKALVAYAGLDSPPYQSGIFVSKSRHISKKGSSHLRRTVFTIVQAILIHKNEENQVYQFLDRKRQEGKHYFVYMTATCSKFLRVYYGKVHEALKDK